MSDNVPDVGSPPSPPEPPPPTSSSETEKPETSTAGAPEGTASADTVNAGLAAIIGKLEVTQFLPDPANPVSFSVESAWKVTAEAEEMSTTLFVADSKLVDDLATELEKRRVLLLTGERGIGKATMAIYLSTLIAKRAKLPNSTLVVDPLDRQVRIDIRTVVETAKDFGKRATVFTDVFARRNRNLNDFFAHTARLGWEELAATLRANSAYLIFTAETADIEKFRQLSDCLACRQVPSLSRDLVTRGLEIRLRWLETNKLASADHLRIAAEQGARIILELTSLPRVVQFLDQFVCGEPDLDAALSLFNDIGSSWFSKDLAADVDAWCFALTLALTHSAREVNGVGWYEFDSIRRAITNRVKNDSELFPRRRSSDSREFETDEKTAGQSFSDDSLLARCRAQIGKDSSRLGDAIRFIDDSYAATIWQHVVTHNRRVLTMLLPTLRTLAEEPGDYGVRALAAQMIGRIGELDPFSISIPIVRHEWSRSERQRPFVGSLLQGMRASGNAKYQQSAIGAVDSLAADRSGDPTADTDGVLTAISAYSQLGDDDARPAMERLGSLAIEKLAPIMANLHEIGRVVEIVDRSLARASSKQRAEDLLVHRFRLAHLARRLDGRRAQTILAMKQGIVYLCLTTDPIPVLRAMRDWIAKGGQPAGTLVALLFLHGGIAEELESVAANVHSLAGGQPVGPIVISLASSPDGVQHFAMFLADLHASINAPYSLPADLQNELRDRFTECLTGWARSSLADAKYRSSVTDLYVTLTHIRDGSMRDDIYALFASAPFTDERGLRDLAAEVRRKRLQLAGGLS